VVPEQLVFLEIPDLLVFKDLKVVQVHLEHKEVLALKAQRVHKDHKEQQVTEVFGHQQ